MFGFAVGVTLYVRHRGFNSADLRQSTQPNFAFAMMEFARTLRELTLVTLCVLRRGVFQQGMCWKCLGCRSKWIAGIMAKRTVNHLT